MFKVSFFSLCQSFRPFFLFFFSSFLGPREARNGAVLRALFGANSPSTWGKFHVNLGQIHCELGANSMSQLGANFFVCPKGLWISLLSACDKQFLCVYT